MNHYYSQLKERLGEEGAREYMRAIRSKRKSPGYFSSLDKEQLKNLGRKGGLTKTKDGQKQTQDSGRPG